MRRYGEYRNISPAEEALEMHRYWEDKYLIFTMTAKDGDSRLEKLADKAERSSKYWLDKYNILILVE